MRVKRTDTVRVAVIKKAIQHHPYVKNHVIHNAHPLHPFSGGQRLRELRNEGISYGFDRKTNTYHIYTPLRFLKELLPKEGRK